MKNRSFLFTFLVVGSILGLGRPHILSEKLQGHLPTGWYYIEDSKTDYLRQLEKSDEKYYVNPDPIITVKHFSKLEVEDINYDGVASQILVIRFDSIGNGAWRIATSRAIYKKLALIIDDKLVHVPRVNAQITSGISALNRGTYSKEELEAFAKRIKMEM